MNTDESMLDVYIYETQQLLQGLENALFAGEEDKKLSEDQINEIFRIMHTIKGSSAMMEFDEMAKLAHILEDMFSQIRDNGATAEQWPAIFDLSFEAVSFFNGELSKLLQNEPLNGSAEELESRLKAQLAVLKGTGPDDTAQITRPEAKPGTEQLCREETEHTADEKDIPYYKVKIFFEDNCQMEGMRAFGVTVSLKDVCENLVTIPENLENETASDEIRKNGFCLYMRSHENPDLIKSRIEPTLFLKSYSLITIDGADEEVPASIRITGNAGEEQNNPASSSEIHAADSNMNDVIAKQNFISVNVNKLDNLLNIVGEIVTAQSMVINNAHFGKMQHDNFDVAARQLHSLINELQDIVMNIRMIPVSTLFQKMRRLVREMSKKFGKDIELVLLGEETEVDKNVIDYLSDPLLHIIRNSVDHGIEDAETRQSFGKPARGKITLEAKTTGNDVIVTIADDGRGLQRDAILGKALEKGLISRADEDIPDKDVFAMIFLPGFSTKEEVTEFSGRGVGMDVVRKNISQIGGSVTLESEPGRGTTHIIRIPLTLTIVDGMKFTVGKINFIVPTVAVRAAVKPNPADIFRDPAGNEMIMLLGECFPLVRLSAFFNIQDAVTDINEGMIMHIISEQKEYCIFFDQLEGEHQVVVKSLPNYLQKCSSSLDGIGGCAVMGDGSINLILDINGIK
ncbi:MAG: ATP-binding protein [Oscillospiraceae bacterium]